MASFNKIVLVGTLLDDPDIKSTNDGVNLAKFRVAVDRFTRSGVANNQKDFFNLVAWRERADYVAQNCKKGSLILAEGSIHINTYDNDAGQRIWITEIDAREIKVISENNAVAVDSFNEVSDFNQEIKQSESLEEKKEPEVEFNFDDNELGNPPAFGAEVEEDIPF